MIFTVNCTFHVQLKSEDLVRAYITRINEVNPLINALIGQRFESAIEEAKEWDQMIANKVVDFEALPLIGIPITIKECHAVKGMPFTGGLYSRRDVRAEEDAKVVQNLKRAGAIPLGVTNVPEFLLYWDTDNKIYGQTNNPYDKSRISGGSSGGEAALISSAASLVGLGSDLGGSIRIPSFLCGVFGHKPTAGVVPITEVFPYVGHKEREKYFQIGPLCRYACDLRPMLKACAGDNIELITDIDKQLDLNKLRVFYMRSDGDPFKTQVSQHVNEAIDKVVDFLDSKTKIRSEEVRLRSMKLSFLIWVCTLANHESPYLSEELTERTGRVNGWLELCKWFVGRSHFRFSTTINVILYNFLNPDKSRKTDDFQKIVTKGEELRNEINDLLGMCDHHYLSPESSVIHVICRNKRSVDMSNPSRDGAQTQPNSTERQLLRIYNGIQHNR